MDETERLSALVGDIYDAALDPTLWVDVLGKTKGFVGGQAAALAWKDAVTKRGDTYYDDDGLKPYYRRLYFDKYIKMDPCTTGQFFADIGEPVATEDLIPYGEFVQTRLYKEWARPQGLVDAALALLEKSATNMSFLALFRHERHGLIDDEARRRMRLVVPHFRHAAGGRLILNAPQADQTLADAFAAAGNGDAAIGAKGVAVPLIARDGGRLVAHVLPLTSGARRRAGTSYAAVAALFVHKAALDTPSPPEVIAKAYKLTPMELRVMLAIVEVGGVPEVAEALGIAETTVKTHLGRVYKKTDSDRQADLVKLVAAFSNPLLDRSAQVPSALSSDRRTRQSI